MTGYETSLIFVYDKKFKKEKKMEILKRIGLEVVTDHTIEKYTLKTQEIGNYLIRKDFDGQSFDKLPLSEEEFNGLVNSFDLSDEDLKELKNKLMDTKKEKLKKEFLDHVVEYPNAEECYYNYLEDFNDAKDELKWAMNEKEKKDARKKIDETRKKLKKAEREWERQRSLGKRIISLEETNKQI